MEEERVRDGDGDGEMDRRAREVGAEGKGDDVSAYPANRTADLDLVSTDTSSLPPPAALFEAVHKNDLSALSTLLALGLPTEIESNQGFTPLVIAVRESHTPATRLLLAAGADPNHRVQQRPPLVHAALAATDGPQLMLLLLDAGAVENSVSGPEGRTVLHWAAGAGRTESVEFLVGRRGVEKEARCAGGHTAVTLAAEGGFVDVVEVLVGAGAEVGARSRNGGGAAHWAGGGGHVGVVRFLVGRGVGVEERDGKGDSKFFGPLMKGVRDG